MKARDYRTSYDVLPKPLTKEEEERCLQLLSIESKRNEARELLINHNLRLVGHIIIKKFLNTGLTYDEMFSLGVYGLIKGVDAYSLQKNTKLTTFLGVCICNEILMEVRKKKRREGNYRTVSMQSAIFRNNDGEMILYEDVVPDEIDYEMVALEGIIQEQEISQARKYLSKLTQREKKVFEMSYGINGQVQLTQEEIAEREKITQPSVSRINKRVLKKLTEEFEK